MPNTAKAIQAPSYSGELVELNKIEAALATLRAKHGNVPDFTTKPGYEQGKASIRELTSYRTGTDKARLAITKPHREFIEEVNQFGKILVGEIEQLEKPLRDAKQEVDEAEARKKEERIARLRERIQRDILSFIDTAQGMDSSGLADLHEAAERIDTGDYYDVTNEAEDARAEVTRRISDMHSAALDRERIEREQAEIAAERRRLREEEERRAAEQAKEDAARAAEQAELEELRRFKAEQEATAQAIDKSIAAGKDEPSDRQPIDTSRLNTAAANFQRGSDVKAPETVTIPRKEYDQLLNAQSKLDALEAAGVDSWSGYGDAMAQLEAA